MLTRIKKWWRGGHIDSLGSTGLVGDFIDHKHKLLYGSGHGALKWAPFKVKRLIVNIWNPIACQIWGHSWFGPIDWEEDGEKFHIEARCSACSKKLE